MKELTFIFLLLSAPGLAQCFPVTASQGGNRSVQLFFCKTPGCGAKVTKVFCNDELLIDHINITDCTGAPPLNTVCQRDGRAFVSVDTDGDCEFEEKAAQIETEKCADHSNICDFTTATTSAPVTTEGPQKDHSKVGHIVGGVVGGSVALLLIVAGPLYLYKKRQNREQNQQPASEPGVTVPLTEMQSPEETSERDTRGGPGLDDDGSPSQRDPRA